MIFKAKNVRNFLSGPWAAVFLLTLYLAGNVQVESFHDLVHSLEKSLHSVEQEKDPCHRAIYHEIKNDGCDHKTHFTAIKKCPLCHVVPVNVQHVEASNAFQYIHLSNDFGHYLSSGIVIPAFSDLPSRAPPVL